MKKLLLLLSLLLTACFGGTSVEYTPLEDLYGGAREGRSVHYAKSVSVKSSDSMIISSGKAPPDVVNQIDKCFSPAIRSGDYSSLNLVELVNYQDKSGIFSLEKTSAVPDYKLSLYSEILDKLCNQYGSRNDLRKIRPQLLNCWIHDGYGYQHPWLAKYPAAECNGLSRRMQQSGWGIF